jgi:Tol biopolymer transport system component
LSASLKPEKNSKTMQQRKEMIMKVTIHIPVVLAAGWLCASTTFAAKPPPTPPPNPVITYSAGSELHVMDADGRNNLLLNKWAGPGGGFGPQWSADHSQIVFPGQPLMKSPRGIYKVDADGTDYQLLVIAWVNPHWSPGNVLNQGEKIVFSYPADASFINADADLSSEALFDLFVMNPDGSGLTKLTDTPDLYEYGPAWSPDGTKLAVCVRAGVHPACDLYVYDLEVVDGKLRATPMRNIHGEARSKGIDLPVNIYGMDWADDSDVLAIVSRPDVLGTPNDEIFLLDLNTFEKRRVITSAQLPGGALTSPSFSPDGSRLVFTRRSDKSTLGGIFSINVDGTGLKKLATATWTSGVDWAK